MAGIPALLRMGRCLAHTSELYVMCQMQRMVSGAHSCDMTLWKQQHQQWPQQQRIAFSTQGKMALLTSLHLERNCKCMTYTDFERPLPGQGLEVMITPVPPPPPPPPAPAIQLQTSLSRCWRS